ncbi:MAG: hypothetical protein ABI597_06880 [Gammaproteobacteria bacterium]
MRKPISLVQTYAQALKIIDNIRVCNMQLQKKKPRPYIKTLSGTAQLHFDKNTIDGFKEARKYFNLLIYYDPKHAQLYIDRAVCNFTLSESQVGTKSFVMLDNVLIDINMAMWLDYTDISPLPLSTMFDCLMKKFTCLIRLNHPSWLEHCYQSYLSYKVHLKTEKEKTHFTEMLTQFFTKSAEESKANNPFYADLCMQLAKRIQPPIESLEPFNEKTATEIDVISAYLAMPKLPSFVNYTAFVDRGLGIKLIIASLKKYNSVESDLPKAAELIYTAGKLMEDHPDSKKLHKVIDLIEQAEAICIPGALAYAHKFRAYRCLFNHKDAIKTLNNALEAEKADSNKLLIMYFYISRAEANSFIKEYSSARKDILTAIRLDPEGGYPTHQSLAVGVSFNLCETQSEFLLSGKSHSAEERQAMIKKIEEAQAYFQLKNYQLASVLLNECMNYKFVESSVYGMLAISRFIIEDSIRELDYLDYIDLAIWLDRTKASPLSLELAIECYTTKVVLLCLADRHSDATACYHLGLSYLSMDNRKTYNRKIAHQLKEIANSADAQSKIRINRFAKTILPHDIEEKQHSQTTAHVIALKSDFPDDFNYLAKAKTKEEAIDLITKSLRKHNPTETDVTEAAKLIYSIDTVSQIIPLIEKAQTLVKIDHLTYAHKIHAYIINRQYTEAIACCTEAMKFENDPNLKCIYPAYFYFLRSRALLEMKQNKDATADILTGIRLDPLGTYPTESACQVAFDFSISEQLYFGTKQVPDPTLIAKNTELAFSLLRQKKYSSALQSFYDLVKQAPSCGAYYYGIAFCSYALTNQRFEQRHIEYMNVAIWLIKTKTTIVTTEILMAIHTFKLKLLSQNKQFDEAYTCFQETLSCLTTENDRETFVNVTINSIMSLIDTTSRLKEDVKFKAQINTLSTLLSNHKLKSASATKEKTGAQTEKKSNQFKLTHAVKPIKTDESKEAVVTPITQRQELPDFINYLGQRNDAAIKIAIVAIRLKMNNKTKPKGKITFDNAAADLVNAIDFIKSDDEILRSHAIAILNKLESDNKMDCLAYATKLQAYLAFSNYDDAIKCINSAIEHEKSQTGHDSANSIAYFYFALSDIYMRQQNFPLVKKTILMGVRQNPNGTYPGNLSSAIGIRFNQCEKIADITPASSTPANPLSSLLLSHSAFTFWSQGKYMEALWDYYALSAERPHDGTCYGDIAICRYLTNEKKFNQDYLDYLDIGLWLLRTEASPILVQSSVVAKYYTAKIDLLCINNQFDEAQSCIEVGASYFQSGAELTYYNKLVAEGLENISNRQELTVDNQLILCKMAHKILPDAHLAQKIHTLRQMANPTEARKIEKLAEEAAKRVEEEQRQLAEAKAADQKQKQEAEAKAVEEEQIKATAKAAEEKLRLEKKKLAEEKRQKEAAAKKLEKQERARINKEQKAEAEKRLAEEREANEHKKAQDKKLLDEARTARKAQRKEDKVRERKLKEEAEIEARAKEEARLKAETEAKELAERERLKQEAELKARAEEEAKLKTETEAKALAELEKIKQEAELKARAEEARLKAENEAKESAQEKLKQDVEKVRINVANQETEEKEIHKFPLIGEKPYFKMRTPTVVNDIFDRLNGFENYIGGTCVSNALEGKPHLTTDFDTFTSATIKEVTSRFTPDEIRIDFHLKNLVHRNLLGKITASIYCSKHLANKKLSTKELRLEAHATNGDFTLKGLYAERISPVVSKISDPTGKALEDFRKGRIITFDSPDKALTRDSILHYRALDVLTKLSYLYGRQFYLDSALSVALHENAKSLPLRDLNDKKNQIHWILNLFSRHATKLNFDNLAAYGTFINHFSDIKPSELIQDNILAVIKHLALLSFKPYPIITYVKLNLWILKLLTNQLDFHLSLLDPADKYLDILLASPGTDLLKSFKHYSLQTKGNTYFSAEQVQQLSSHAALTDWVLSYLSIQITGFMLSPLSQRFEQRLLAKTNSQELTKWIYHQLFANNQQPTVDALFELGLLSYFYKQVLKKPIPVTLPQIGNDLYAIINPSPVTPTTITIDSVEAKKESQTPTVKVYMVTQNPNSFMHKPGKVAAWPKASVSALQPAAHVNAPNTNTRYLLRKPGE